MRDIKHYRKQLANNQAKKDDIQSLILQLRDLGDRFPTDKLSYKQVQLALDDLESVIGSVHVRNRIHYEKIISELEDKK